MPKSRLGNLLVDHRLVTETDYDNITKNSSYHSASMAKGVVALGIVDDEELAAIIAESTPFKRAPRDLVANAESDALGKLNPELMSRFEAVPLRMEGNKLTVALADPLDQLTIRQIEFFTGLKVRPVIASLSQIRRALARLIKGFIPRETPLESLLHKSSDANLPKYARAALEENKVMEAEKALDLDSARSDDAEYEDLSLDESFNEIPEATPVLKKIDGDEAHAAPIASLNAPAIKTTASPVAAPGAQNFDINAAAQLDDQSVDLDIMLEETSEESTVEEVPIDTDFDPDLDPDLPAPVFSAKPAAPKPQAPKPLAAPVAKAPEKPVVQAMEPAPEPVSDVVQEFADLNFDDDIAASINDTPAPVEDVAAAPAPVIEAPGPAAPVTPPLNVSAAFNKAMLQMSLSSDHASLIQNFHKSIAAVISRAALYKIEEANLQVATKLAAWDQGALATTEETVALNEAFATLSDYTLVTSDFGSEHHYAMKIPHIPGDLVFAFHTYADASAPLFVSGLTRLLKALAKKY